MTVTNKLHVIIKWFTVEVGQH